MSTGRRAGIAIAAVAAALGLPGPVVGHSLHGRVDSPLPFAAYILGAAVAVALSFAFIALSDTGEPEPRADAGRVRRLPVGVRLGLRAFGLIAWLWVVGQTIVGGSSDAEVASLILWSFGWVGLAIASALVGPVWAWLDPFSTLYDLGRATLARLGVEDAAERRWPPGLGAWVAVAMMAFFVWLELAARVDGGRILGLVLIGYTLVTLAGMATFGRDAWRERAEVFSVWFGLLGRFAPWGLEGPASEGRVRRRGFGTELVRRPWTVALVSLVAIATGSVIYDGLSQTQPFFEVFGIPTLPAESIVLLGFLAIITGLVLAAGRLVGLAPVGAGIVPVAVGYLVAHYLTFLIVEGQRIMVALSDPFQQGWDLFGTAFWEPREDFLATSAVWTVQVGAVVLGHVTGAWLGHRAIRAERAAGVPVRQGPLAFLMIGLTALTLWSLGQNLAFESGPVVVTTDLALAARWP